MNLVIRTTVIFHDATDYYFQDICLEIKSPATKITSKYTQHHHLTLYTSTPLPSCHATVITMANIQQLFGELERHVKREEHDKVLTISDKSKIPVFTSVKRHRVV
jgi:hypothetical protein